MFEKEPVLCPYCQEEMEEGHVRTTSGPNVFYLPEDSDDLPPIVTEKVLKKRNGFFLDGPYLTRMHDIDIPCHACRKCRKVIISCL